MLFCWTKRRASTSRSGTCELTAQIALADSAEADELAVVAARTFPLACPPEVSSDDIAAFIAANLSAERFAAYAADPRRAILTARHDDRIVGYAMLVRGESADAATELSKIYLLPRYHGDSTAAALMDGVLATAADWAAASVWLGVNQKNQRAQRFYVKHGFRITGTRTFRLGARLEHDYVMTRDLASP